MIYLSRQLRTGKVLVICQLYLLGSTVIALKETRHAIIEDQIALRFNEENAV